MKMKFSRAIMKKAVDICNSISDNKQTAKVWIRSFTETDILLYSQRDEKGIKYFHHIKTIEPLESNVSFIVNPNDLVNLLKGKEKVREWEVYSEEDKSYVEYGDSKVLVQSYTGKFPLEKLPYTPMNDEQAFLEMVDEIVQVATNDVKKIEIGGYGVSIKTKLFHKRYNFVEDFPLFVFPTDYIAQLKKNIIWPKKTSNRISSCTKGNELYIRIENRNEKNVEENVRQLFVLTQRDSTLPNIKQLEEEVVHNFKINAKELWNCLNSYKSDCEDVYLYDEDGKLSVSPCDQDETSEDKVKYSLEYEGFVKRTKLNRLALMGLLSGYVGQQSIDILKYNDSGEEVYAFRMYDKKIYSLVLAKKEPNFAKIQAKLDQILAEQSKLQFLFD